MKILLVDDSDDMRHLVELFLKMLSHTVVIAEDGSQAFGLFTSKPDIDLIFMDMRMPVLDGYAATQKIRQWELEQKRRPVPIVAMTAFSNQDEIAKSLEAGCNCHLVKPVNRDALARVIVELTSASAATPTASAGAQIQGVGGSEPIRVKVDPDLADLIPGYIEKRRQDVGKAEKLLQAGQFEELRSIGHKIKGSGGGYGFSGLSEIGAALENAAKAVDGEQIKITLSKLQNYLERLEII